MKIRGAIISPKSSFSAFLALCLNQVLRKSKRGFKQAFYCWARALYQRNTFHRDKDTGWKRHYLWCTSCRCIIWKNLGIYFIKCGKFIARYHKYCCLDDLIQATPRLFQNGFNISKCLPCLFFKTIADNVSR